MQQYFVPINHFFKAGTLALTLDKRSEGGELKGQCHEIFDNFFSSKNSNSQKQYCDIPYNTSDIIGNI